MNELHYLIESKKSDKTYISIKNKKKKEVTFTIKLLKFQFLLYFLLYFLFL